MRLDNAVKTQMSLECDNKNLDSNQLQKEEIDANILQDRKIVKKLYSNFVNKVSKVKLLECSDGSYACDNFKAKTMINFGDRAYRVKYEFRGTVHYLYTIKKKLSRKASADAVSLGYNVFLCWHTDLDTNEVYCAFGYFDVYSNKSNPKTSIRSSLECYIDYVSEFKDMWYEKNKLTIMCDEDELRSMMFNSWHRFILPDVKPTEELARYVRSKYDKPKVNAKLCPECKHVISDAYINYDNGTFKCHNCELVEQVEYLMNGGD